MVAPNSPASPPRRLSSSASAPNSSLTKAPAPTAEEYALVTVMISVRAVGGTAPPTVPKPARVWEEVVMGQMPRLGSFMEPNCPSSSTCLPSLRAR